MILKAILVLVFAVAIVACGRGQSLAKTASHIVTAQMRANALANVEKYDWAKSQQQQAINAAQKYVEMSDEELWRMVLSQWVPRELHVNRGCGCPNCGDEFFKIKEFGYLRWEHDIEKHPWKLKCKNCGTLFPSNDYGAYYESGLDGRGEFDPEKADKSLLFNPDHPDPEDPNHRKWVDDGFGAKYEDNTLAFVARCAYLQWLPSISASRTLARAYTLTGEPIYAHKAAVLLDRYADVYPNIDYSFISGHGSYLNGKQYAWNISDGGSGRGMIQGCIWETTTANRLSYAYDVIYEQMLKDQELVEFCAKMRQEYPGLDEKPHTGAIARHIEDNLITLFCEAVIAGNIHGNIGSHQRSMAMAAIALDRQGKTEQYLDWLFQPDGGMIPTLLTDLVSRDGPSFEATTGGYGLSPGSLVPVADLLQAYEPYQKHDMYRDFPKMKQLFVACQAYRCLNQVKPSIGDAGSAQAWGDSMHSIPMLISGFRAYGTEDIARELWHTVRYDRKRLEARLNIHETDEERQELLEQLLVLKPELPIRLESANNSGYGLAILQSSEGAERGSTRGRCAYISYGRTCGSHPHKDRLNFGIFAKHMVMNPDLGYPQYPMGTSRKRGAWTNHTMSHNTVTVNDRKQSCNWGGKTELFIGGDPARIAIVNGGPPVYENLRTYKRAVSLIDVSEDDSYVVDVFWVRGGTNHRMVNNGPGREVTHQSLQLAKQATGTFAGPNVEFKAPIKERDEGCAAFSWLRNVERGNATSESCWIDWDAVRPDGTMQEGRDPHLRMHCLSSVDEIAIAIGEPPHQKHNPDAYLRYVVRSRLGEDLESQFVTVLEPYESEPFIASAEPLELDAHDGEGFAAAVQIDLADGRTDIVIIAENPCQVEAAGLSLDGQMAFIRLRDGKVEAAKLVRGTKLQYRDYQLTTERGEITGKLAGFDVSDWRDNLLKVESSVLLEGVAAGDLIGQYIIVKNSERSCGSYPIKDIRENGTVISLGDKTLVERFVDPQDYSKGVIYSVAEGDEFTIPLSVSLKL